MVKTGLKMAVVILIVGVVFFATEGRSEEPKPEPAAVGQGSGVADAKPAPVNPHNGMQEREEKFEFAEKPTVKKEGDKWIVTFATTANCDATVSIVAPDGKVIRHLASGVLGKNAPHPFQQNSLSQKVEWDGQTDDFKKAPAGCKVRVGLGLKAKFERNIAYDPNDVVADKLLVAKGKDGTFYVGSAGAKTGFVRAFDKDGKYLRTILPYPAAEVEKSGAKLATTVWGEKLPVADWYGLNEGYNLGQMQHFKGNSLEEFKAWKGCSEGEKHGVWKLVEFLRKIPGVESVDITSRPTALPPTKNVRAGLGDKYGYLVADPAREEIYAGDVSLFRFSGKTGENDPTFKGVSGNIFDHAVGPDGLLYLRIGRGAYLVRLDHDRKNVPFKKENTQPVPEKVGELWIGALRGHPLDAVWCGGTGRTGGCFNFGLHVSSSGLIATTTTEVTAEWDKLHGVNSQGSHNDHVLVFDPDGKLLTADAVGRVGAGQGISMDRDGSLYVVYGEKLPAGQNKLDGITDVPVAVRTWGGYGILVKYRGLGGKYPLNVGPGVKVGKGEELPGALWAYPIPGHTDRGCLCAAYRHAMDRWGRLWVPANQLYSIVVLDANGNRMARLGRYGNVDDTEADLKEKKDGIRFVWPRAVAASDTALYVSDFGSLRILKAALSYAAEETAPLP